MKRYIVKKFRRARRDICRFIISFDTCPPEYRKHWGKHFLEFVEIVAAGIAVMYFFVILALISGM